MTDEAENPRAVVGANVPPIAERLALQYAEQLAAAEAIAARANAAPRTIETDEQHEEIAKLIKDARGSSKTLESHRKSEKDPYLKQAGEVDGVFVTPRDRMDKIVTAMNQRVTAFLQAKEAAERARREEEARAAREREAAARAEAERQLQEAKRLEQVSADVAETKRIEAAVTTSVARSHASTAFAAESAAAAKPAELARTRTASALSTLEEFWDHEIIDHDVISLVVLRPFIKQEHIEMAVREFVRVHGGSKPLAGVRIFRNSRAKTR